MVERETVENQRAALGDEHAVVDKVLRGAVRCGVPEGGVHTEDLLDDRANVRQVLLIFSARPAIASHDSVQFLVRANLHVMVLADESEEPLNNSRSLDVP